MIVFIVGTKAELIKTIPVMRELEKIHVDYYFIHTGQHSITSLINDFGVKKPDIILYTPPKLSSRFMVKIHKASFWALPLVYKLQNVIKKLKPVYVLYHGDTITTCAAAIASSRTLNLFKKWKNAHLEAGLRSFNLLEPFPEEISRKIADRFSDTLFAPSDLSVKNLEKEKLNGEIIKVGNTIIESVFISLKLARKKRIKKPKEKKYVVVNIHRHENIKSKERMKKIVEIIKNVSLPIYWPIHDNTKKQIEKFGLFKELHNSNIKFSSLLGYIEFIHLLKNSTYIITDGGSIQEESLVLKKPCILLRKATERQEGLKTGINFLTKLNVNYAKEIIDMLESSSFKIPKFKNPYGDGKASKRIANYIIQNLK
ncbi:MAG: UDP-N-acetylglucosamine 2-epimerase (non-hydrolyzing) [Candidatus Aenigmarchaeota archaeon]|nr:UDP-N-acetylglucosamine 2-epimerase (non-hydrolyzing) [Candidatus Aenigmarchaeota archaeon]MDW8149387.1 UDP-N-acetylglucosamine 2-epimerase (non-hydrolyzing) [Candidatus Aenigmarchaeota archaeon]